MKLDEAVACFMLTHILKLTFPISSLNICRDPAGRDRNILLNINLLNRSSAINVFDTELRAQNSNYVFNATYTSYLKGRYTNYLIN